MPVPTTMSPSATSTQRLTRAMKLRRVMRAVGGSEVRADGEGPGEPAEERARLARCERGGARRALHLFVPLRAANRWNGVAGTHAVQRRKPVRTGRDVVVDRAG